MLTRSQSTQGLDARGDDGYTPPERLNGSSTDPDVIVARLMEATERDLAHRLH